jgi:hypothetical protein
LDLPDGYRQETKSGFRLRRPPSGGGEETAGDTFGFVCATEQALDA